MTRAVVAGLDARAGNFPIRLTEGDALPFTIEFLEADGATPTPLAAGTYVLEVRRAAGAPVTHTVALTRGGTGNHELTGTFSAVLTAQIGSSRTGVHAIVNTTTSSTLLAGELELVPRGEAGAGWPDNLARVVGLPGPAGPAGATGPAGPAGATGGVATDAIFDAKGDLPVGTGADAAAKLTVGADGSSLTADSSAAAGVAWLGAVSIKAPKTADGGIHTPETTLAGGAAPQYAANAQVATWFPCWVHKPVRPLLRSYCFTLEAGSSARFALWTLDHATIRPGTLIEDLGLMAGTSTGAKALSASTATVTGWFFLAVWASNHTTVRWGRPTFDASKCQMFGTMEPAWGRNQYGWRVAGVDYSSAWNSTLPTLQAASDIDHANPILPYWEYT